MLCAPAALAEGALLVTAQGITERRTDSESAWLPAKIKDELPPGSQLRTGELSKAGLLFPDRTQIRLGEKTELTIRAAQKTTGGGKAALALSRGVAWMRSRKRASDNPLKVRTPTAVAAIRGTEWSLAVAEDGTTTLTVLRGDVDLANEFGSVNVAANELATARPGKAPVKRVLVSARDRMQWVSSYQADPLRHLRPVAWMAALGEPEESPLMQTARALDRFGTSPAAATPEVQGSGPAAGVLRSLQALHQNQLSAAELALSNLRSDSAVARDIHRLLSASLLMLRGMAAGAQSLLAQIGPESVVAVDAALLRSDLAIVRGETQAARAMLQQLPGAAGQPQIVAQQLRIAMLTGDLDAARRLLQSLPPGSYDYQLGRGELGLIDGDAKLAFAGYGRAAETYPARIGGWYGLGRSYTDAQDISPARTSLDRALQIDPERADVLGEKGVLLSFSDDLDAAQAQFEQALSIDPDDYSALTGLGILQLKRGQTEAALDTLLKATLIEPRFARAHLYMGVANYQLGDVARAEADLKRATELDNKDPLPWYMLSLIATDQFRPGDAVDSSREALKRQEYVKSLSQLLNDQTGSANVGAAYAEFGLESWATTYAQQSYSPLWAGSHLFLSTRYPDASLSRNSELFQGFLLDPVVFGADPKQQLLVPRPGNYQTVFTFAGKQADSDIFGAEANFQGLSNSVVPFAYFIRPEYSLFTDPDTDDELRAITIGLGTKLRHDIGVFAFGNVDRIEVDGIELEDDIRRPFALRNEPMRVDLGGHYRPSPNQVWWFKTGISDADFRFTVEENEELILPEFFFTADERRREVSLRNSRTHTTIGDVHAGVEVSDIDLTVQLSAPDDPQDDFNDECDYTDRSEVEAVDLWVSVDNRPGKNWLVNGGLWAQRFRENFTGQDDDENDGIFNDLDCAANNNVDSRIHERLSPRLGVAYAFGTGRVARVAYQDWTRPPAAATLAPIATAGIPIRDILVSDGGNLRRLRAELEWEWTRSFYTRVFADYLKLDNESLEFGVDTPANIETLQSLTRATGTIENANLEIFQEAPQSVERGTIANLGVHFNKLWGRYWGTYLRYERFDTKIEESDEFRRGSKFIDVSPNVFLAGFTFIYPNGFSAVLQTSWQSDYSVVFADDFRLRMADDRSELLFLKWESPRKRYRVGVLLEGLTKSHQERFSALGLSLSF